MASERLRGFGASRAGVWLITRVISPLDRAFYRWTGGRGLTIGRRLAPRLLLTTTGRRTGKARTAPVFYLRDGERLIVCNVTPPFERSNPWVLNLRATPEARIQIGRHTQTCRAHEATEEEVARYWPRLIRLWPSYKTYFDGGGRRTVFILEPAGEGNQGSP